MGVRVRLRAPASGIPRTLVATIVAADDSAITVAPLVPLRSERRDQSQVRTIPRDSSMQLDRSLGASRTVGAFRGIGIAFAVYAGLAASLVARERIRCRGGRGDCSDGSMGVGALMLSYAPIPLVAGALLGAASPVEQWQRLDPTAAANPGRR